jgi:hypothetical protein
MAYQTFGVNLSTGDLRDKLPISLLGSSGVTRGLATESIWRLHEAIYRLTL